MPFLLAEILNFQGSTHRIGVGSFSYKLIKITFGNEFYGRQNVIKFFIKLEEIIKNAF